MPEIEIADTLKTTFHERCLAVVNRGLGMRALNSSVVYETRVNDALCPASFFRGDQIVNQDGKRVVLWSGLLLDDDNEMFKTVEAEPVDPLERPELASADVMTSYLFEDLREMFAPDLAKSILFGHLQSLIDAERLGVLDVTSDDIHDAIATMDELILAHDTGQ